MIRSKLYMGVAALVILMTIATYTSTNGDQLVEQVRSEFTTAEQSLRLSFLDVGQGDATLVEFPDGTTMLIDGGPDRSILAQLGESLPPWRHAIDRLVLTHPHSDHVAGLSEVIRTYDVGEVIMTGAVHTTDDYLSFLELLKQRSVPVTIIDQRQETRIGGVSVRYLEPHQSLQGQQFDNLNNSSIVLRLDYASTSALLMGDYEQEETLLSTTTRDWLRSDVLKVGHHGSSNGSERNFLAAVAPRYAVIMAGLDNSYGHPHYRTLYYLEQLGAIILRTDRDGTVVLESDGHDWALVRPLAK